MTSATMVEQARAEPRVRMTVEQARAMRRYKARRDKQRAAAARQKLQLELIQRWGALYLAYQQASRQSDRRVADPAYDQARDALLAFGAGLKRWPGHLDALRSDDNTPKPPIRLQLMARSDDPTRVAANIVAVHEKHQRTLSRKHILRTRHRPIQRE